jgi:hypothetical protein
MLVFAARRAQSASDQSAQNDQGLAASGGCTIPIRIPADR